MSGVALNLETALQRRGIECARISIEDLPFGRLFGSPRSSDGRLSRWMRTAAGVVYFTVGATVLARPYRADPGAVIICHGDALAGDVYINHGLAIAAARTRGGPLRAGIRNPLAGFVLVREWLRWRLSVHDAVVNLTRAGEEELLAAYPTFRGVHRVIGNGVDLERFRLQTEADRAAARIRWQLPPDAQVVLFVGHEFDRKGLRVLIDALARLDGSIHLLVAGGSRSAVRTAESWAETAGVRDRVVFAGTVGDAQPLFAAADAFALPSAYEASALVLLESLASGVPVVATAVGSAPDIVVEARNGFLVSREPGSVADGLRRALGDGAPSAESVRASAVRFGWDAVAIRYMELLDALLEAESAGAVELH